MLHILFLLLKIIGILLLVILGIALLLACMILFLPVRYQVHAKTEHGLENLFLKIKVTWFFHLIYGYFDYYNKKTNWKFRIAWKELDDEKEIKSKKQKTQKKETIKKTKSAKEEKHLSEDDAEKEEDSKKQSIFSKIKCTIIKIYDKIKAIWEKKDKIVEFFSNEIHRSAFCRLKKEISLLAKHLRPRKLKGFVCFGFDDPYKTGQLLAVLSVLYPFYGERIQIKPDFEKEILEGELYIKGHMRVLHFLLLLCKLIGDKDIRNTYKNLTALKK